MSFIYVYVLRSLKDGNLYIGITGNLKRRYYQHQMGQNTSTAKRRPFKLIFYEAYRKKVDARRRERYFKTSKGKTVLRQMMKAYFEEVQS